MDECNSSLLASFLRCDATTAKVCAMLVWDAYSPAETSGVEDVAQACIIRASSAEKLEDLDR